MVKGRTISPTVKSVVAQQASELLDFVQRRRFQVVFTANIIRIMRRMPRGQVEMIKAALIANAK